MRNGTTYNMTVIIKSVECSSIFKTLLQKNNQSLSDRKENLVCARAESLR